MSYCRVEELLCAGQQHLPEGFNVTLRAFFGRWILACSSKRGQLLLDHLVFCVGNFKEATLFEERVLSDRYLGLRVRLQLACIAGAVLLASLGADLDSLLTEMAACKPWVELLLDILDVISVHLRAPLANHGRPSILNIKVGPEAVLADERVLSLAKVISSLKGQIQLKVKVERVTFESLVGNHNGFGVVR